MKSIHFPTLTMHLCLLLFAHFAINDYPDLFLCISIPVLIAHFVWALKSKHGFRSASLLGVGLQFAAFGLGWIEVFDGAFGLGGGEFALQIYQGALILSFAANSILHIVRMIRDSMNEAAQGKSPSI